MSELSIQWHGWDATCAAWHGPDELDFSLAGSRGLLGRLRQFSGSWTGRLGTPAGGGIPLSLWASVHDLGDTALAALDADGSPGGPLEVLLVAPAQRRPKLRAELAFEFVSYLRFLEGAASSGRELALHEYIEHALAEPADPLRTDALVFSIENRLLEPDVQFLVSQQAERLAMSMIAWMAERDGAEPMDACIRSRARNIDTGVLQ
jgi:hypothetical protein